MLSLSRNKIVKLFVALITLTALMLAVDFTLVIDAISQIDVFDILVLCAISFALVGVSVWKWQCFLTRLGIDVGFWRLFQLYLVGYFVNLLAPSFVGGDVVRSLYLGSSVDKARAVSSTLLERYTGVVAMIAIALLSMFLSSAVTAQIRLLVVVLALGCAVSTWLVFAGAIGSVARRFRLPAAISAPAARIESSLTWGMSDPGLVVKTLLISVIFHILTVINTAAVGAAVGWSAVPWGDLFVVVPLILIVGAVPISPQGLGIQEGAFVYFLTSVGVTPDQALAIALVLRAKSYVLAGLGGLVLLALRRHSDSDQQTAINR